MTPPTGHAPVAGIRGQGLWVAAMTRYKLGWATYAEGLPCLHPDDFEFSAGWCDAMYTLTEDGEFQESGEWLLRWHGNGWAVAYEPSWDDIIAENEHFAHAGAYYKDDEVMYD
jgi:hypothetical protein